MTTRPLTAPRRREVFATYLADFILAAAFVVAVLMPLVLV